MKMKILLVSDACGLPTESWQYATFVMMQSIVIWVYRCLYITFFGVLGKYSPEHSGKSIFHSAPAYSLSGRSKECRKDQTPGNTLHLVSAAVGYKVSWHKEYKLHVSLILQAQPPTVCLLCWGPKLWPHVQLPPTHSVAAAKLETSTMTWRRYIYTAIKTISLKI